MASSLPQARAEVEERLHPCQQEEGEDFKALQLEGTAAPAALAAQRLPDWTIPFGTGTASLVVGVAQPLPHLGSAHAAMVQSALIARGVFEHVFINA